MMNSHFSTSILFTLFLLLNITSYAQDGESIFKSTCAACHKITSEKLIGPGLAKVHEKRSEEWFDKFVKSSQALIKSGDADAIAIFEEFNNIIMPDQALSDADLDAVWGYIQSKSETGTVETVTEVETPFEPSKEDIIIGQNLFTGKQRFINGGTSCISCHHIRKDDMIAGGGLAKDLTDVYTRLTKVGVEGMITGLPFPQMKSSYQDHQITKEETSQLLAFLKDVGEQSDYPVAKSYRNTLLLWGIGGAAVLMDVFPLFWYKRKKESVNKRIYERQIKSHN